MPVALKVLLNDAEPFFKWISKKQYQCLNQRPRTLQCKSKLSIALASVALIPILNAQFALGSLYLQKDEIPCHCLLTNPPPLWSDRYIAGVLHDIINLFNLFSPMKQLQILSSPGLIPLPHWTKIHITIDIRNVSVHSAVYLAAIQSFLMTTSQPGFKPWAFTSVLTNPAWGWDPVFHSHFYLHCPFHLA